MTLKSMIEILNKPLAVGLGAIAASEVAEQTVTTVTDAADGNPAQAVHILVQIIIGIATLIKMFRKPKQSTDEKNSNG
jgi:hypothetical protein